MTGALGWLSRLGVDFSSGHDLTVCEFGPTLGSELAAQSLEPASDSVSLSLSLCPSPVCVVSLSLSEINKLKKKKERLTVTHSGSCPCPCPTLVLNLLTPVPQRQPFLTPLCFFAIHFCI